MACTASDGGTAKARGHLNLATASSFWLEPEEGVIAAEGQWHAVALPAWLRLLPANGITSHSWVKIRYSAGFFDEPCRPLIRFTNRSGKTSLDPMNGTTLGTAEWIGRIPNNIVSISISPVRRLGSFSFRIESIEPISKYDLMRIGFISDRSWTLWSMRSRLINSREEAWQALKYARGGTPIKRYAEWRRRLVRPLEWAEFDRPRADWTDAPTIHFFMRVSANCESEALQATVTSLQSQLYRRWVLHVDANETVPKSVRSLLENQSDDRIIAIEHDIRIATRDWIAIVTCGDTLEDYALAVIIELIADEPDLDFVYCDEDAIDANGIHHSPALKPDWSPLLQQQARYIGRLSCIRYGVLASHGFTAERFASEEDAARDQILPRIDRKRIAHLRRILYHRAADLGIRREHTGSYPVTSGLHWPSVSVVIPTRDRADLLSGCLRGLREKTDYPLFDVTIVDNGSVDPQACALLAECAAAPRFKVLRRPGPFNYSQLCNDGVRETDSPVLVFLNNDVEMIESNWLKELVRFAVHPRIGVVGAKLLFLRDRIQHAGVVLGMGGIAGHVYRRCAMKQKGYLSQLEAVRETTANTAACVALERAKFETVGGFDAKNLPVDLNDVDLCLRIAEKGWTNVWNPRAVLIHAQSATRGVERDPFQIYRQERAYFTDRWMEAIRDDPYFHPALSLFSQRPALS